jgi:hypothetical protein
MMLSQNDVFLNDNKLFGPEIYHTYIETRMDYNEVRNHHDYTGSPNAYLSIFINMDNSYTETIRTVSNFAGAIS